MGCDVADIADAGLENVSSYHLDVPEELGEEQDEEQAEAEDRLEQPVRVVSEPRLVNDPVFDGGTAALARAQLARKVAAERKREERLKKAMDDLEKRTIARAKQNELLMATTAAAFQAAGKQRRGEEMAPPEEQIDMSARLRRWGARGTERVEEKQQALAAASIQRIARGRLSRAMSVRIADARGGATYDKGAEQNQEQNTDESSSLVSRLDNELDNELAKAFLAMPSRGHIQAPLETVPSRFGRSARSMRWLSTYEEGSEYDGEWRPHAKASSEQAAMALPPAAVLPEPAPKPALVLPSGDDDAHVEKPTLKPSFLRSISSLGPALTSSLPFMCTASAASAEPPAAEKAAPIPPPASAPTYPEGADASGAVHDEQDDWCPPATDAPRVDGVPNELCLKCFDVPCSCPKPSRE